MTRREHAAVLAEESTAGDPRANGAGTQAEVDELIEPDYGMTLRGDPRDLEVDRCSAPRMRPDLHPPRMCVLASLIGNVMLQLAHENVPIFSCEASERRVASRVVSASESGSAAKIAMRGSQVAARRAPKMDRLAHGDYFNDDGFEGGIDYKYKKLKTS